ncbi:MAG: methionyl-tRNA formyltransferase [Candidatus Hydrogenedentota bacterium]
MKIVFAGTPEFASVILQELLDHDDAFELTGVLSQPARPRGRGLHVEPSEVERLARERSLPLATPAAWNQDASDALASWAPDILVTAAYGMILPREAFSAPPLGAINVHASLLPRWRGAAPIQRAIEAGDPATGISIFQIGEGVDTGPVYARASTPIEPDETSADLSRRLAALGAELLPETLKGISSGALRAEAQSAEGVTRARKLRKVEGHLSWSEPASVIHRKWRAYHPWPGVTIGDIKLIEIERTSPENDGEGGHEEHPGEILSVSPLLVASSHGSLRLNLVQRSGGRVMNGADYANGRRLAVGDILS